MLLRVDQTTLKLSPLLFTNILSPVYSPGMQVVSWVYVEFFLTYSRADECMYYDFEVTLTVKENSRLLDAEN